MKLLSLFLSQLNLSGSALSALSTHCARHSPSTEELTEVHLGESLRPVPELQVAAHHQKQHNAHQAQAAAAASSANISDSSAAQKRHQAAHACRLKHPSFAVMQASRANLPAWGYREQVVELVKQHAVVLISGETGCGKTTQVPQFLLDDALIGPGASIVCTQPRRISAISVAERIAQVDYTAGGQ